jgi:hypothetical protein
MTKSSWKGKSTNIVVSVLTAPSLTPADTPFKARPIRHYRKSLSSGGSGKLRSMPMDLPGGVTHTNSSNCADINGGDVYVIKENIDHVFNCNDACKPIRSGVQDNMTDNKGKVVKYGDARSYMRARTMTYEQNTKSNTPTTTTFDVTIGTKGQYDSGSTEQYLIDGRPRPDLELIEGNTYIFLNSDNAIHPFKFSTSNVNSDLYSNGVTVTTDVAPLQTKFVVPYGAPEQLYYVCGIHHNMGASITIKKCEKRIFHKPNNSSGSGGFQTQGAVSSGDRLLRLKLNTIQSNCAYRGDLERYTVKKNTPCLAWRRQGKNSKQACA